MLSKSALGGINMRRSLILSAMVIAGGLVGLSACDKDADAAVVVDKAKVREAVKGDVYQLVAALNDRNAAKAAAHDAPGMVGMFHGAANTVGVDQDIATTKKLVGDPNFYLQLGNDSVDVSDAGLVVAAVGRLLGPGPEPDVFPAGDFTVEVHANPDRTGGPHYLDWPVMVEIT